MRSFPNSFIGLASVHPQVALEVNQDGGQMFVQKKLSNGVPWIIRRSFLLAAYLHYGHINLKPIAFPEMVSWVKKLYRNCAGKGARFVDEGRYLDLGAESTVRVLKLVTPGESELD